MVNEATEDDLEFLNRAVERAKEVSYALEREGLAADACTFTACMIMSMTALRDGGVSRATFLSACGALWDQIQVPPPGECAPS